ncbi:hypothetical protein ACQV2R_00775 [Facklamia sp. P12937]
MEKMNRAIAKLILSFKELNGIGNKSILKRLKENTNILQVDSFKTLTF